jgi:hypothetical protein
MKKRIIDASFKWIKDKNTVIENRKLNYEILDNS